MTPSTSCLQAIDKYTRIPTRIPRQPQVLNVYARRSVRRQITPTRLIPAIHAYSKRESSICRCVFDCAEFRLRIVVRPHQVLYAAVVREAAQVVRHCVLLVYV
jgi:hypothetical protein